MAGSSSPAALCRLLSALFLTAALLPAGFAQRPATSQAKPLELSYVLSFPRPHTHLYEVVLTINNVSTPQLDLLLPIWTPGSYLAREYARHVQDFSAADGGGQPLKWRKTDKATWRVEAGASAAAPRTIRASYRVYANELFTQTSHLDATHAYFNGATLFMYVASAKDRPHRLKIEAPAGWRTTSPLALQPDPDGYFTAADYDRLIDSPTEVGTHRLLEFTALGKPHRVAIWGDFNFDEERLKGDLTKIIEVGAQIFGGLPYEHYTFLVHVQPGIGGGTEHLNSNVSMTTPAAFRTPIAYRRFLGLESHEYFHHWNVKRIRPIALGPFDYQRENYTNGLWVSEGITSYYGDLLLRRAGLTSSGEFFTQLAQMIAGYEQSPGRLVQSAETASFNAWIKHYRPDENSPNTVMSYYTRGEILGLLFDLEIRSRTNGARSLDDVMRELLQNHGLPKPGFTDAELKAAFDRAAGADLSALWNAHVSGTEEIDFDRLFRLVGMERKAMGVEADAAGRKPGTLGLRTRAAGDRVVISNVFAGLPAYDGGLNSSDEIAAIDGRRIDAANIAERLNEIRDGQRVALTVFRREKLLNFELTAAPRAPMSYLLAEMKEASDAQKALRRAWLNEKEEKK
ncbi:MAG: PDZ domain-containing protein [Blastocatellia bacterium]|nr:PDZ domain-containing protein [Blastocatellia bacterium]